MKIYIKPLLYGIWTKVGRAVLSYTINFDSGMGQDRNFSRQDNSRQRQNLETQDKTTSRQPYCCQDNSRLSINPKFWFKTSQEFQFFKIHKTRQIKTRFLSRKIQEFLTFWVIFD